MKLVINYDLIEAIKNINEPFGVMKIVRNEKREWIKYEIPTLFILEIPLMIKGRVLQNLICVSLSFSCTILPINYAKYKVKGDYYAVKSSNNLKYLACLLRKQYIDTDYELLLQSEYYDKKYKLRINETKTIEILESKYLLVPTYNYNGEIRKVSIEQEHVMGSKIYTLSLGSPERQFQYARSIV